MLRLTAPRLELLAEKFGDLANLAVAALVFGQALGLDRFSPWAAVTGVAVWVTFTGFAFALSEEDR